MVEAESKIYVGRQRNRIDTTILKNKVGELKSSNFKTYSKATVIKHCGTDEGTDTQNEDNGVQR